MRFLTLVVSCFSGVISDDENETSNPYNPVDREDMPDGSRTPPTPPSQSPPPTYDGISCTLWLGEEARMAVTMHLITARSRTGMLVHWVTMQSSLCCQTNSQGFCLSITLVDLKLWIFLQYRTTGASLMCMVHLRTIR